MPCSQGTMDECAIPTTFGAATRIERRRGASFAIAPFAGNDLSETA
jgi:hypothetical protein